MCAPMLLAEDAVLCIYAALLGNPVIERDHLLFGGTSSLRICLSSFAFFFSREGLLDVFECFEQLANTLGYCGSREFILVLPVPWDHL